jgi:hypothetical protein
MRFISKLNHPEVHNMGDAGQIIFGPLGREVLSGGTVIFAVFATGGQLLAGQIALASLSDSKLCLMLYTGIFTIPVSRLTSPYPNFTTTTANSKDLHMQLPSYAGPPLLAQHSQRDFHHHRWPRRNDWCRS